MRYTSRSSLAEYRHLARSDTCPNSLVPRKVAEDFFVFNMLQPSPRRSLAHSLTAGITWRRAEARKPGVWVQARAVEESILGRGQQGAIETLPPHACFQHAPYAHLLPPRERRGPKPTLCRASGCALLPFCLVCCMPLQNGLCNTGSESKLLSRSA